MQPFGPAVLRLGAGVIFAAHGAQKLFGVWGGGGPSGMAAFLAQHGLTPAYPLALVIGILEFAGGLMLIAGAFTLLVAFALTLKLVAGVVTVHLSHGFFLNWTNTPGQGHGYEFSLMLIGALISLMLTGPGAFSVDSRRARFAETAAAGRARLRAGHV